jgi:hypothetical protein
MSKEKFHIHLDASRIGSSLRSRLLGPMAFSEKNFIRGGRGAEHSPDHHLTKKYWDRPTFESDFASIVSDIEAGAEFHGYIEGEFIALDRDFPLRPGDVSVGKPLSFSLAPLPKGSFRETELHLTVASDLSEQAVLEDLFDMGFFCAYAPKAYGTAQIFTVQGSLKHIDEIKHQLIPFLERRGGLSHASLKEERIVRWWTSAFDLKLPPVVDAIHPHDDAHTLRAAKDTAPFIWSSIR